MLDGVGEADINGDIILNGGEENKSGSLLLPAEMTLKHFQAGATKGGASVLRRFGITFPTFSHPADQAHLRGEGLTASL
jgi:hypothetical protein